MDAVTYRTQSVGALPVIAEYLDRLQVGSIIDRIVPGEAEVPLGRLVQVLIVNRLLQPKALFRVEDWARQAGVADYFGLSAGQLNDDRLGRALERLASHAEAISSALALQAIRHFQLKVEQIHYDLSSVELYGAYADLPPEAPASVAPRPTYGRSKSGRKNLKQVQLALNVSGDGGVPLAHATLDGNTAEQCTHRENLLRLARMLPTDRRLYLSDSKLDTPENLLAVQRGQGQFICRGVFSPALKTFYRAHQPEMRPLAYAPPSRQKPAAEPCQVYQAMEFDRQETVRGEPGLPVLRYRLIFLRNAEMAQQEAQTRQRHMDWLQQEFQTVAQHLNRYNLKSRAVIERRLQRALARYSEGKLWLYQLTESAAGLFQLSWSVDGQALQRVKDLEGVYVLKSSLPQEGHPIEAVLGLYKQQIQVERRFHHLKGPLAVTPMFLKNPRRIAGLMCVLVWSLMVLALMERQVRRNLKGQPLYGLYPENRPSPSPTGPALLEAFSSLSVVIIRSGGQRRRRLSECSPLQRKLLGLLDIPAQCLRAYRRRLKCHNLGCGT